MIGETVSILIADSTAVKTDRLYRPSLIGCKRKKRKVVDKMNILAEYYPEKKIIAIVNADAFFTSDAYSAITMLDEIETCSPVIFADAGFDCEELFEKCLKMGIKLVIRKCDENPKRYRKLWNCLMRKLISGNYSRILFEGNEKRETNCLCSKR